VTEITVAWLAEKLELLVLSLPSVAVFVVFTRTLPADRVATSNAGYLLVAPVVPHGTMVVFVGTYSLLYFPANESFILPARIPLDMDVKSRHHLRSDAIGEIQDALDSQLGVALDADSFEKVELTGGDWDVVLVDGEPLVFYLDGEPFLTVRGANEFPPTKRTVTVDAGAIQFVSNGADTMRPGIVETTDDIEKGDLVVINEESHGKFLAIGRALVDADEMTGKEGRVVESVHHVGDDLYELSV